MGLYGVEFADCSIHPRRETAPLEISKCGPREQKWWLDIGLDEKAPSKRNHIEMALTTQREESLRRLYVALTRGASPSARHGEWH